jgi:hypothetical protein
MAPPRVSPVNLTCSATHDVQPHGREPKKASKWSSVAELWKNRKPCVLYSQNQFNMKHGGQQSRYAIERPYLQRFGGTEKGAALGVVPQRMM